MTTREMSDEEFAAAWRESPRGRSIVGRALYLADDGRTVYVLDEGDARRDVGEITGRTPDGYEMTLRPELPDAFVGTVRQLPPDEVA